MKKTHTSDFGVSKREGHDASAFYARSLYGQDGSGIPRLLIEQAAAPVSQPVSRTVPPRPLAEWADRIYCHTSEEMLQVPDNSIALAFTSPPYNTGKKYEPDMDLGEYLGLISRVAAEVYRVLIPGGRYVINVANLGRKPYIPLHAYFYAVHTATGFLPAGEIIWRKGRGSSGNCAWGSWKSAKAPGLRDLHEYLLVLTKEVFGRPDKGESDISGEEFMEATLSVWEIPPERAKARRASRPLPGGIGQPGDQTILLRGRRCPRPLLRLRHHLRGRQGRQPALGRLRYRRRILRPGRGKNCRGFYRRK